MTTWYRYAQIKHELEKEAGWKENVQYGIMAAMVAVFFGSGIMNAAKKYNVSEQELSSAFQRPEIVEQAKELASNIDPAMNTMSFGTENTNAAPYAARTAPAGRYSTPAPPQTAPDVDKQIGQFEMRQDAAESSLALTEEQKLQENIIARTIYREGTAEPHEGRIAIASVIFNRGNGNAGTIMGEIQKSKQFSCWNKATEKDWTNMKQYSGGVWDDSMEIASSILRGSFTPTTKANHYFNPQKANPSWAYLDKAKTKLRPYQQIGNHLFMSIK